MKEKKRYISIDNVIKFRSAYFAKLTSPRAASREGPAEGRVSIHARDIKNWIFRQMRRVGLKDRNGAKNWRDATRRYGAPQLAPKKKLTVKNF